MRCLVNNRREETERKVYVKSENMQ